MKQRRMERLRAYQKKMREADRANYNERRRIEGGISRSRKAVEKWTAEGNAESVF